MLRSQQTISSLTPKDGYQNGKEKDTRRKAKREEVMLVLRGAQGNYLLYYA